MTTEEPTPMKAEESTFTVQRLRRNDSWLGTFQKEGILDEESTFRTFPGNQARWIESATAEAVFNEVTDGLKLPGVARPHRRRAVLSLLNALCDGYFSSRNGDPFGVLWPTSTSQRQDRYTAKAFSAANRKRAAEHLQAHGYVQFRAGHSNPKSLLPGRTSVVLPTEKLRTVYESISAEAFQVWQDASADRELILLQDDRGKLIDYEETHQTQVERELLRRMNAINHRHYWSYDAESDSDLEAGAPVTLNPWALTLKRRYKAGSFQCYGRMHCEAQGLAKRDRRHLQVDYEDTVELDYKHMLPALMYAEAGKASPEGRAWAPHGDAYELGEYPRRIVKKAFLICVNTASRSAAEKAIWADSQFQHLYGEDHREPEALVSRLMAAHRRISGYFFTEAWRELNYLESSLMLSIVARCAAAELPVLPIHDGLVCREQDRDKVLEWMVGSFRGAYGLTPGITEIRSESEGETEVDLGNLAA